MNLNKIKNFNYKNKIITVLAVYTAIIGSLLYFLVLPTAESIKGLKADILTEKVEQEKRLNMEKNYASLGSKIKQIEKDIDALDNTYINSNRKLEFITTLEGLAATHNVSQTLNLDLDSIVGEGPSQIDMLLNLTGSYDNLLNYLISLETLEYYVNVTLLNLTQSSPAQPAAENKPAVPAQYSMRLQANTYWK